MLTQKPEVERAVRSVQLVFWGVLAGLVLGTIIGTLATRYWYTALARPGPAGSSQTPRVTISPRATPEPGEGTAKSVTERQGTQITVKGHAKGPARLAKSAIRPQEVPILTGEGKSPQANQIGGPDPRIPGPEEAKNVPDDTVGGTASPGEEIQETPAPASILVDQTPAVAFCVGDRAEGTVTGEIEIVDAASRPINTKPLTITGEYTLDFPAPGQAELDLRFTAPATLSIETPSPMVRNHAVYLSASAGWLADRPFAALSAGYARRWPLLGGLSARTEIEAGWSWTPGWDGPFARAGIGIVYEF